MLPLYGYAHGFTHVTRSNLLFLLKGVPEGALCGREEWDKFQAVLGTDYQLHVISRDFFNAVVYEGPHKAEKKLYLYHAADHFSVITSMPAFVERHYYCDNCHIGYNNLARHVCKHGCKCCRAQTECAFEKWIPCSFCRRFFVSQTCHNNHLKSGVCAVVQACPECGKVYHSYEKHVCGQVYCKVCKDHQPLEHLCYMKPLTPRGIEVEDDNEEEEEEEVQSGATAKKVQGLPYIFYDFECMLVDKRHVPNLCVVQKVCTLCMDKPMVETCACKREQVVFKGEDTLRLLCEWLFSGKHRGAVCLAHNSQGYDAHLILDYIHDNGLKPGLIENGKKIMSMEIEGLQFTDSLNYFQTALAKLPKIFGIKELHKGFFPHLFSTPDHQHYKGPMPDASYYDPDGMREDQRKSFLEWYQKQSHFDYQADLEKYCVSDVDILRRCCSQFRSLFQEHAGGIDPFHKCFTIASACNKVYRTMFLQPEQVGIIPPQGYASDNQSTIAICWLDWMAKKEGVEIQHALNGGERRIEGVKVDGVAEDGTVYEFHGCFYHGHEACYPRRDTVNPINGLTMKELREKTLLKTERLRSKGHVVVEKWECEFKKDIADDPELKTFFKEYEPYTAIVPHDGFFGGRTNAIILYIKHPNLRYVDFTSLYPWVCKYGLFPLRHPVVYHREKIPARVQGLLKCKVLPPAHLYHALLPARINGKLMFPLCRTCAEEAHQGECQHNEDERALTGTWVSLELDKAVELGYEILERYTAWHFEESTQYDPETQTGGLWAEYINLWLKLKVEASGYPSWCVTEQQKEKYIADYLQHEGIRLDPTKIQKNEGLRSLAKLMLNSHWGKFGQNADKSKITYVSDPAEYVELMTDDTLEVTDLMYANKEHVAVRWRTKGEFLEVLPNTNVILAAYTTAQARLKLYTLLEGLQERVVYFDTDSVVYIHDENQWNPPLGDHLGELKDETNGVPITEFVSGGAKNYAYHMADGKPVCKIRGKHVVSCR